MIKQMSAEDFIRYAEQHGDVRFDFIDGEVVEVSPKPWHAWLQALVVRILGNYLDEHPLGYVHTEGLHVLGEHKFLPDVSINVKRLKNAAYFTEPPLLAVEIRSDSQSRESQRRKARQYIELGAKMVWLILPDEQIEVYTSEDEPIVYSLDDILKGDDVMPGFEIPVKSILSE